MNLRTNILTILFLIPVFIFAQEDRPNPFDYGKMWTFENPPAEWFKEAYDFDPGMAWFDDVRKSSLRFATWCSASFVSPNGLIMTNHHCSRDVVADLQKNGENFDKEGFYASKLSDERKAEGLFVEQLIMTADITDEMLNSTEEDPEEAIKSKYTDMEDWSGLRLQVVSYYSGGKYSLYGYKRYDDIRLVWIPELDLGFFGGDPDNFTFPRYNLDCTFWRAYDENGKPLNTADNYLEFNINGAEKGDPVFVVGNPGSTERYRTVAQLTYDRDIRYPMTYKFLKNRNDLLVKEYNELVKDPEKEFEAQALLNQIANVANGMKAYGGIVEGLNDDQLFGRKVAMENYIRSKSDHQEYWEELEAEYEKLIPHGWAVTNLSPSGLRGKIYGMMLSIYQYEESENSEAEDGSLEKQRGEIVKMSDALQDPKEQRLFKIFLQEIQEAIPADDNTLDEILGERTIEEYISYLLKETKFSNSGDTRKHLKKTDKLDQLEDPLVMAGRVFGKRYMEAAAAFRSSGQKRKDFEAKVANEAFKVYGTSLPPDATFTLRISDGVIKAYNYNGTIAPEFTTYYGLYDRHYSHNQEFPWNLPERWMNPPHEFMKTRFNCVSTNDIIGGNSGSPLINTKGEAVGLIFDGNIESLPGNFIFDEEANRTVSVTSSGIYAALKYIFKADRIVKELEGSSKK